MSFFYDKLNTAPTQLVIICEIIFLQESEFGVMVSTRDGASVVRFESLAPTNFRRPSEMDKFLFGVSADFIFNTYN